MQLIALSGPAHALVAGLIAERWVAPSFRYSGELARARPLAVQSSIDAMLRAAADQRADCLVVHPVRTHAEADLMFRTEQRDDLLKRLEQAEAEVQRLRVAEAEAMNILEGTELKLEQAEDELALRDRMLRDIIERIALTPERWNGWTTEEVLADLRARAEKEAER